MIHTDTYKHTTYAKSTLIACDVYGISSTEKCVCVCVCVCVCTCTRAYMSASVCVCVCVIIQFNITFNIISVISWWCLLVADMMLRL